jgi:glycosyltransferase involved in cell wall biosynthesis
MKIVHLSWYDINGGAARAALRVHESLRLMDAQSSMFVGARESHDPDVKQYVPGTGPAARLKRLLRRDLLKWQYDRSSKDRPAGFDDFRDDRTIFNSETGLSAPDADIYHLHQITDFLDYRGSLGRLAARAPIVWTLHEMTPFTGGCHYTYGCDGFTRSCGGCPQLGSRHSHDLSNSVWKRKDTVYQGIPSARLHVVGASTWIAAEAQRSSLLRRFPISVIPYGLDTDIFKPMPEARRLLDPFGLKSSMRIVLFVTDWMTSRRKGFDLLDAALAGLPKGPDTALVSLGRGDAPKLRSSLPYVHLGSLTADRMIAAVYSMADLFVMPSLQDNLPNTVMEAMACGAPVVGFRVGGIPDMVRQGENGLLVPPGDVGALSEAIHTLLSDDERRACMGRAGRAIVEREYSAKLQGERYLDLYRSILDGHRSGPKS